MPDIKFKPLNLEEEKRICKETPIPYLLEFKSKKKNLFCLGIEHSSDFSHPQFKIIEDLIKNQEIILVESNNPSKEKDNEISFILSKNENLIPIIGCDLNLLKAIVLISKKFDPKDILLLRSLVYLNKPERRADLKKYLSEVIEIIKNEEFFSEIYKKLGFEENFLSEIIEDYLMKNNEKGSEKITAEDSIYPTPLENKTILNEISREISYTRDAYMLKSLNDALNKFNRILYILGKNHIVRQERIITELFKEKNKNDI
jgi:hypothetical protein